MYGADHQLTVCSTRFKENRIISPLLRLPAELRMHIWKYTLGGNIIAPKRTITGRNIIWEQVAEWWWTRSHLRPGRIRLVGKPNQHIIHFLSVLRVCRQIYHEARLLPFSCNVWQCQIGSRCSGWLKTSWTGDPPLDTEQRNAIACISIECVHRNDDAPRLLPSDLATMRLFKGLKVIVQASKMHTVDEQAIEDFAQERGCRVAEYDLWDDWAWIYHGFNHV